MSRESEAPSGTPAQPASPPTPKSTSALAVRMGEARHDLRNSLSAILGFSEILQEEAAENGHDQLGAEFKAIHQTATQILKDVNQRLDGDHCASGSIDLKDLLSTIGAPSDHILASSEALMKTCQRLEKNPYAEDLSRVYGAARRLREIAAALPATLAIPEPSAAGLPVAKPSDPDRVGTFEFSELELPQRESEFETSFLSLESVEAEGAVVAGGSLLVVEDNEANRELLTRRLERQGYTVTPAENGRRALDLLNSARFDLVLLDIVLPEVDGYQVLEHMKSRDSLRHIPVIMISALDDLASLVRCIQKGADDYLTKPFDPVLLRARIGACLEKKRLRDREVSYLSQIEQEKKRSDELLRVILPDDIAEELILTRGVKPRRHENVGILFCDVVDFTAFCGRHEPEEVLDHLQSLIKVFETLAARHGLEKIKTIGDAFMAAGGLRSSVANPGLDCVRCGLDMVAASGGLSAGWQVHVGIHIGPVIAGVVGSRKYLYDVWGDTVNTAARVTSLAGARSVVVSGETWQMIQAHCRGHSHGRFEVKGKGQMEVFRVESAQNP
jgi:adenylate cyclase